MDKQAKDFEKGWEDYKAEKAKAVEEMAKELIKTIKSLHICCYGNDCDKCCYDGDECVEERIADALIEKCYRKIPEGAVVLTKEEYDDLQKGVKTHNYTAMFDEQNAYRWEQGYLQGRQETAEKFAEMALREIKAISAKSEYLLDDESTYEDSSLENVLEKVKNEIAKEITEGNL